jgi:hypothetical protein
MVDSNFVTIDSPRFFASDPGGSMAIPGIQNFALTMPYGGLNGDQLRGLKDLEKENERLRRAVSDLTLDILTAAARGNL